VFFYPIAYFYMKQGTYQLTLLPCHNLFRRDCFLFLFVRHFREAVRNYGVEALLSVCMEEMLHGLYKHRVILKRSHNLMFTHEHDVINVSTSDFLCSSFITRFQSSVDAQFTWTWWSTKTRGKRLPFSERCSRMKAQQPCIRSSSVCQKISVKPFLIQITRCAIFYICTSQLHLSRLRPQLVRLSL